MSKSLFISYDGLTDPLGQSQVIPYLQGLAKNGYEMHVLSCEKPEEYEKRKNVIQCLLDKFSIQWHPIFYHKSPPVLSTLYDIYQLNTKTKKLHKKHSFNILHCRSYISALIGLGMKKNYQTKFLFDMRGFWADERVDGKLWNLKNPLFKSIYDYFKKKEKDFFQQSDYIISLTHNGKDVIQSGELCYDVKTPIAVIPCCVDLELFAPKESLVKTNKDFTLSYIGSIGTWYMLEEMLDFFKVLLSKRPNAKFLFVTRESKEWILSKCKEKDISIDNIEVKSAERNEVPNYIQQSDASIFFIKPVFSKRASSPTKQGEIMAMGIPIVCNTLVGDTDYVIEKFESGVLVEDFTSNDYEKAVDKLLNTNFEAQIIKKGASEFYSLDLGIEKYTKVYKCLS